MAKYIIKIPFSKIHSKKCTKEKLFGYIITNRTGIISIHTIISNMPVTHVAIYLLYSKSNLGSSNAKVNKCPPGGAWYVELKGA